MYFLDTDTIIYSLKGNRAVLESLRAHINDEMKVYVVTLMELNYGVRKSQQVTSNLAKVRAIGESFEIVPIGSECAEVFGLIKLQPEKGGSPLDDFDLIVASCAISHNLTLVPKNMKHFQRIKGLKLENRTVYPAG